jgi:hypothetical protein
VYEFSSVPFGHATPRLIAGRDHREVLRLESLAVTDRDFIAQHG